MRRIDTVEWSDGSTVSVDRPRWLSTVARRRVPAPIDPENPGRSGAQLAGRGLVLAGRALLWVTIVAAKTIRDLALVAAGLAGAAFGIARDTYHDSFGS